jgi:hypothetical protein
LGKTQLDVERDTPLAKAEAIAQSQLDNEVISEFCFYATSLALHSLEAAAAGLRERSR